MRLGFILGFLLGGGIASLIAKMQEESDASESNPVVGAMKRQMNEARDAAREARLEKEAEMRRMHDDMVHRKPTTQS